MLTSDLENGVLTYGVRVEKMDMSSSAFDQDGNPTKASSDHTFVAQVLTISISLMRTRF